jgi:hypothetical protein
LSQSLVGVVESEFPFAVEIEPDTANKLWTRVLWAGDLFLSKNHAKLLTLQSVQLLQIALYHSNSKHPRQLIYRRKPAGHRR